MKNEKGFIAISIIYSVFVLFIMILVAIMFSYMSDRKSSNRIKEDIKNQFSIGSPIIAYSQEGSEQKMSSYSVTILVTKRKFNISQISYVWSKDINADPTTSITSGQTANLTLGSTYTAGNYYLITKACDTSNSCTTMISKPFNLGS